MSLDSRLRKKYNIDLPETLTSEYYISIMNMIKEQSNNAPFYVVSEEAWMNSYDEEDENKNSINKEENSSTIPELNLSGKTWLINAEKERSSIKEKSVSGIIFSSQIPDQQTGDVVIFYTSKPQEAVFGWGRVMELPEPNKPDQPIPKRSYIVKIYIDKILKEPMDISFFNAEKGTLSVFNNPSFNKNKYFELGKNLLNRFTQNIQKHTLINFPYTNNWIKPSNLNNDKWTVNDQLNYKLYSDAICNFIRHPDTSPPLTMSIESPWGGGKTSLMKMIQKNLDETGYDILDEPKKLPGDSVNFKDIRKKKISPGTISSNSEYISIWFNAWKYQSTEQVWAGLADAIIRQCAERLENRHKKELFFFQLHAKRINQTKIRNALYQTFFTFFMNTGIKWLSGTLLALATYFTANFNTTNPLKVYVLPVFTVFTGAMSFLHTYWKTQKEPIKIQLKEYVDAPDYAASLGFIHHVYEDLNKVFEIIGEDKQLVIFIDDLDRCSPTKVAEVFEAINLFLGGESPGAIIIFGMDTELVAASLQEAHKDIINQIKEKDNKISLGWRFMDKFIQLPFCIPPLDEESLDRYMISLMDSGKKPEPKLKVKITSTDDIKSKTDYEVTEPGSENREGQENNSSASKDSEKDINQRKKNEEARQKQIAHEQTLLDRYYQSEDFKLQIREARKDYSRNPRGFKRFYNAYRFLTAIAEKRIQNKQPCPNPDQLRRWIRISMEWPEMSNWLHRSYAHWDGFETENNPEADNLVKKEFNPCAHYLGKLENAGAACENFRAWEVQLTGDSEFNLEHMSWLKSESLYKLMRREGNLEENERLSAAAGKGFW